MGSSRVLLPGLPFALWLALLGYTLPSSRPPAFLLASAWPCQGHGPQQTLAHSRTLPWWPVLRPLHFCTSAPHPPHWPIKRLLPRELVKTGTRDFRLKALSRGFSWDRTGKSRSLLATAADWVRWDQEATHHLP